MSLSTVLEKAKTRKPSMSVFDGEYFQAEISEASFKDTTGKREMVVTLMREGPGNLYNMNWYMRSALESMKVGLESRKKQYFNHAKDTENPIRDVRDWASSILETWIVEDQGRAKLMGRVRVYDDWLWSRAQQAPDELAVSAEAKGRGRAEIIDGQKYNAIYEVPVVNGVHWVDYPGNAGMGVEVLESQKTTQEEHKMDAKEILEALKGLGESDLASLREALVVPAAPASDSKTEKQIVELRESMNQMKAEATAREKALTDRLNLVETQKNALESKVEAHEIKERAMSKEKLAQSLLSASKIKEEFRTETFVRTLLAVKEYKDGDKIVSESDQMKALIADREKICVAEVAAAPAGGGAPVVEISVEEQSKLFIKNVLGTSLPELAKAGA